MPSFLSSDNLGQLAKALAAAQAEMGTAKKNAVNPHYKNKYPDFASIVEASLPTLSKHGLGMVQGTACDGATVTVATRLLHESGEWIESSLTMQAKDAGPQSLGSAITYGRRYGWSTLIGLAADEDDDGNKASDRRPTGDQQAQAVSSEPVGFAEWLDDLAAVADEGTEALKKAWSQSSLTFRSYLQSNHSLVLDGLKAKAAKAQVLVPELPAEKAGKK